MKSFTEYLEEAVLQESQKAKLAVGVMNVVKSAFADAIKAGCEVSYKSTRNSGALSDYIQFLLPYNGGLYDFMMISFMTPEENQFIGEFDLKDAALDKFDNLSSVHLTVYIDGDAPEFDALAKKVMLSQKFKSGLKKVCDYITKETGVKMYKEVDTDSIYCHWVIHGESNIKELAKKNEVAMYKALSRNTHKVNKANAKKDKDILKAFGLMIEDGLRDRKAEREAIRRAGGFPIERID